MSWNYGAGTNFEFRRRLQNGAFKTAAYSARVAELYSGITILDVQKALNALGFSVIEDDEMGSETATALKQYYG